MVSSQEKMTATSEKISYMNLGLGQRPMAHTCPSVRAIYATSIIVYVRCPHHR